MVDERVTVSAVIPNWNGQKLLETTIPLAQDALLQTGVPFELIVVDDGSQDDSVEWVRATFGTNVKIIVRSHNGGFSKAINTGILAARGEYILCLNSDMLIRPDAIQHLLHAFETIPDLFASTMYIEFPPEKRQEESGWTYGRWENSAITMNHYTHGSPPEGLIVPVLYPGGGSSLYNSRKLRALNLFDESYSPFYYEDSDLGMRAWQSGWPSVLITSSRGVHLHRGTIAAHYSDAQINRILERNRVIFHLKNLPQSLLYPYILRSWLRVAKDTLMPKSGFASAWREARQILRHADTHTYGAHRTFPIPRHDGSIELPDLTHLGYRFPPKSQRFTMILCAYNPFPPVHGGAVRMFNTIRSFAQLGKRFKVAIMVDDFDDERTIRTQAAEIGVHSTDLLLIQRQASPLHIARPALQTDFDDRLMTAIVTNLAPYTDLAWAEYTQMGQYLVRFKKGSRLLVAHDVATISSWRKAKQAWPLRFRMNRITEAAKLFLFETDTVRNADFVLTMSDYERAFLQRFAPKTKIVTSPTGVAGFRPRSSKPRPNDVLFIGSMRHTPNVDGLLHYLFDIWPIVQVNHPDAQLRVVGGPLSPTLPTVSGVHWLGMVDDVTTEYLNARLSVVPVYTGAGIRTKILESLAYGVPVVSTPLGVEGLTHLHDGQQLLVASSDNDFAEAVGRLLLDDDLRERLSISGQEAIKSFYNWDIILGETLASIGVNLKP